MRILDLDPVFCADLAAVDKPSAVRSMVRLILEGKGYSHDLVERMADLVLAREELGTTGVGMGVATPHSYGTQEIRNFHIGVFYCPAGVDFAALDEKPVDILICWMRLASQPGSHLRIHERVASYLANERFRSLFRQAKHAEHLRALLWEYEPEESR